MCVYICMSMCVYVFIHKTCMYVCVCVYYTQTHTEVNILLQDDSAVALLCPLLPEPHTGAAFSFP